MLLVVNILLVLVLFANGFFYAKVDKTSINPVTIFSYFWFIMAIVPIVLHAEVDVSPITIIYILLFVIIFSFPFYFLPKTKKTANFCMDKKSFIIGTRITITFFLIGIISFNEHLNNNGISYLSYLADPLGTTANNVALKYSSSLNVSLFSQVAITLMYPIAFLSGFLSVFSMGFYRYLLVTIAFVLPSFFFLIFGDKGAIFLVIFIFISGVFLAWKIQNRTHIFNKKIAYTCLIVFVILFLLIIIAFLSRSSSSSNGELVEFLLFSIRSYALGHLHAFNDWFLYFLNQSSQYQYAVDEKPFAFYTFKSIYDSFGIEVVVPMGIYGEYFNDGFLETNIYTVFRGLIYDFGIFGSYFYALILGLLVCWSYFKLKKGHIYWPYIVIWYLFFMFVYSSYIVSFLIWRTTLVSTLVLGLSFFVILRVNSLATNKNEKR